MTLYVVNTSTNSSHRKCKVTVVSHTMYRSSYICSEIGDALSIGSNNSPTLFKCEGNEFLIHCLRLTRLSLHIKPPYRVMLSVAFQISVSTRVSTFVRRPTGYPFIYLVSKSGYIVSSFVGTCLISVD